MTHDVDLSLLSIGQLEALIADAQDQIRTKKQARLVEAYEAAVQAAAALGVNVEELFPNHEPPELNPKKKRRRPPHVFVNPANPEEVWGGRGRQPVWYAELTEEERLDAKRRRADNPAWEFA